MAIRLVPKRLIGQTIQGIRRRLGLTQADFAESLGMEGRADLIGEWERGESQPDYPTLARIATMGLVDVLVFHETVDDADIPQVTPGEAAELRSILARMETLLAEARQVVERAASRTAVEALTAAASGPLPEAAAGDGLELSASVSLEATPRRRTKRDSDTASSGTSSSSSGSSSRSTRSRSGGSSGKKKSSGGSSSSGGSKSGGSRSRSGSSGSQS